MHNSVKTSGKKREFSKKKWTKYSNYCLQAGIRKLSLGLYQEMISMGIEQFKSCAARLMEGT